jgi:hypothetical protein
MTNESNGACGEPVSGRYEPTAIHESSETQSTALRNVTSTVEANGADSTNHEVPSHFNVNVPPSIPLKVLLKTYPTAIQKEADTHERD